MNDLMHKVTNQKRRATRVRKTIQGTAERPRLSIHISNTHVSAQLIDDVQHQTLAYSTTVGQKSVNGTMTDKAKWVGLDIAKKAKAKKLTHVVFDRGAKLYHGRVAALADAAREAGMEF